MKKTLKEKYTTLAPWNEDYLRKKFGLLEFPEYKVKGRCFDCGHSYTGTSDVKDLYYPKMLEQGDKGSFRQVGCTECNKNEMLVRFKKVP